MTGSLDPVRAKTDHARRHGDAFVDLFRRFLDGQPYRIVHDSRTESGWHNFRWEVRAPLPAVELALIQADLTNDLRGALDYLVWQLVLVAGNEPNERFCSFPIALTEQQWTTALGRGCVTGVQDRWIEEIKRLQPYQRGDRARTDRVAILDLINNVNKHRTLPIAVVTTPTVEMLWNVEDLPAGGMVDHELRLDDPIEDGAIAFRLRVRPAGQVHVTVQQPHAFRVAFRDSLGYDWGTNNDLIRRVEEIIAGFEPAFV